jgi:arabinogalactan endo-1,4-beta-galactosidase
MKIVKKYSPKKLLYTVTIIIGSILFLGCEEPIKPVSDSGPALPTPDNFYMGTTMGFVRHQEEYGNVVFKENGMTKDPFQSVADHGGNIVRFRIDLPPYSNSFTTGLPDVDFCSPEKVKSGIQRAQAAGLKIQLTFSYQSKALNSANQLNQYVAPLAWQPVANQLAKLRDSVYQHTYDVLDDYVNSGIIPAIVSIGNETNFHIIQENVLEANLPAYSPPRTVALLNEGARAVRDINHKYGKDIKVALHIFSASNMRAWMGEHVRRGLDFDIMGLSHYHGWHSLGDFNDWTEVVNYVRNTHNKDFLMMETAQLFTSGGYDNHIDILGRENIPAGYDNPPTSNTQRFYLKDLAQEIKNANGLGVIVWGAEWVGSNTLIYPDQFGAGSSWENKTYWDSSYNLHDGINWMRDVN